MSEWTAGPDLDAEIARRVFGERIGQHGADDDAHRFIASHGVVRDLPPYSSDGRAAWTVVDLLTERGYRVHVIQYPGEASPGRHCGRVGAGDRVRCRIEQVALGEHRRLADIYATDAPLAICRAALRATPE